MKRFLLLWGVSTLIWAPRVWADACIGHGGYMRCSPSGFSVCEDGTLDKRYPCSRRYGTRHVGPGRKIKFEKRPDRGQVLKAGEEPPKTTLKESWESLKK